MAPGDRLDDRSSAAGVLQDVPPLPESVFYLRFWPNLLLCNVKSWHWWHDIQRLTLNSICNSCDETISPLLKGWTHVQLASDSTEDYSWIFREWILARISKKMFDISRMNSDRVLEKLVQFFKNRTWLRKTSFKVETTWWWSRALETLSAKPE